MDWLTKESEKWIIIIDLDGTIVDSEAANSKAFQQVLKEFNYIEDYTTIMKVIADGTGIEEAKKLLNVTSETQKKMEERMTTLLMHIPLPLLPGVKENMRILRDFGLLLCLVTDNYSQLVIRMKNEHDMSDLFDPKYILAIDTFPKRKPSPEIVKELMKRSGRKRAIIVGNSPKDVAMAQNSGCPAVILINLNESEKNKKGTFDYEKEIFGEISGDNIYSVKSWDDVRKVIIEIIKKKSMEE